ncbi:hypothetical protein [Microviridae sp.]|nr:hypothetical protein [Microviridae sp.]UOF82982.1 hypothetical protein [Microviridae sp.]
MTLKMINQARNTINRHRPNRLKTNIRVEKKMRFCRNSNHTINRRVLLNKRSIQHRQSRKILSQMPNIQRSRMI